jgi:hypothetical protein
MSCFFFCPTVVKDIRFDNCHLLIVALVISSTIHSDGFVVFFLFTTSSVHFLILLIDTCNSLLHHRVEVLIHMVGA